MICDTERRIGQQVKRQRQTLKLTQAQLAKALGVTTQQIHKYEKGIDRLAASRLLQLSKILKAPITFFYEEEKAMNMVKEKELWVTCTNSNGQQFLIKLIDSEKIFTNITVMHNFDGEVCNFKTIYM